MPVRACGFKSRPGHRCQRAITPHARPRSAPESQREEQRAYEVIHRHTDPDARETQAHWERQHVGQRQPDEEPVHERHDQRIARVPRPAKGAAEREDRGLRGLTEADDRERADPRDHDG